MSRRSSQIQTKARPPLLREQDRRGVFQIMQDEVHQHEDLSAVDIADAMGMSVSTFYNKLNPDVETHRLSLDEYRRFLAVTGRHESLRAIARRCGFLLLDLRSIETGSSAVSSAAAQATREFAETLDAYATATGPKSEGGSGFTRDEATRLEEEGLQTIAAIMELIEAAKREAGLPVAIVSAGERVAS